MKSARILKIILVISILIVLIVLPLSILKHSNQADFGLRSINKFDQNYNIERVLGVETQGGSAITLSKVLDTDFNLSVEGYVEGSFHRSTTTINPPLVVASTSRVANLNVDLLEGLDWGSNITFTGSLIMTENVSLGSSGKQLKLSTASSDPTSSLGEGSIYFNSGTDRIRVYNGSSWNDLEGIGGGGGGGWSDGGNYLYPTSAEFLGNSGSAGSNKLAGLYLGDSSTLSLGLDNDVGFSFSGSTLSVTQGSNIVNFDSDTLVVDGANNRIGVGTATINDLLEVAGNIDTSTFYELGNSKILDMENTSSLVVGTGAGSSLTTATNSSLVGRNAGNLLTTGDRNTALGTDALFNLQIGTDNTVIGYAAGFDILGSNNTFVGNSAGNGAVGASGSENVAIGNSTLTLFTTGTDNIAIGFSSGDNLTSGSNNVLIGPSTNVSSGTISNSIAIGNTATATASNQLVIGNEFGVITDAYFGEGVTSPTPGDIVFNSSGGSGTNIAGANFIFAGGKGTGNADGGDIVFRASDAGASGTALQSLSEKMRLTDEGNLGIGDTSPDAKLEVLATTEQLRLTNVDDTTDCRFTVSSTGDMTIDCLGSGTTDQLVLADTDSLNIGGSGSTDVVYNVIGDTTSGASANMNSDDDLYIEGSLEVDGTLFTDGTIDTTFTAGSVIFAGASGVLSQDNASFFFDDATNRVGVGTAAPISTLDVNGGARFNGDLFMTGGASGIPDQESMVPNAGFEINADGSTTIADGWTIEGGGTSTYAVTTTTISQGTRAQEITAGTPIGDQAIISSSCFPVTNGRTYNLYARVRASVAITDGFTSRIEFTPTFTNCVNRTSAGTSDAASDVALTTSYADVGATVSPTNVWGRIIFFNSQPNIANTTYIDSVRLIPSSLTVGTDLAETFPVKSEDTPESGDLVTLDSTSEVGIAYAVKTKEVYDQKIIGIVSTNPGYLLDDGKDYLKAQIALAGRVPTKVSSENGLINIGDPLTSSTLPGVAMKATKAGQIVGKALETYIDPDPKKIGNIMVLLNLSWWDPGFSLTPQGNLVINIPSDANLSPSQLLGSEDKSALNSLMEEVNSLKEKISSLETNQTLIESQLTDGLSLSQDEILSLTSLNVLGNSILGDTVVNGKLSVGVLLFDNLSASVDSISGPLKIQSLALGNVEFEGGLLMIDTKGNLRAVEVTADKYNVSGNSAGVGVLEKDQKSVFVSSNAVTNQSLIYLTPTTLSRFPLSVIEKSAGVGFNVEIPENTSTEIHFDWWIIDKKQ